MSICGVLKPQRGEIWYQDSALTGCRLVAPTRAVPGAEGRRIFRLTVEENLDMGAFFRATTPSG
jgi:ABC-type branched-subunit amino acid transport system ATPase component